MVQANKKIALLHRHTPDQIKETNAAFPYLREKGIDVLTFKKFDRTSSVKKFWKSLLWIFYAPMLVMGKGYEVLYLDDSYPFYGALVKLVSPKSKVVLRIGDFHLMYYYSGIVYWFLHFFEKAAWKMADEIIAISQVMADKINQELDSPVKVVLDPVDPNDFPYRNGQHHDSVMFHGVLTKNKNVDVLLEAAKRLPQVGFNIVGDGPDRKRLEKLAPDNVIFKGWIPHYRINRYIQSCAIGVSLRSDNAGNEFVVTSPFLQYGVMGKPCLVTRRKVFGDYRWQFSGVNELVIKIGLLMKMPEEGKKLREYILENHNAEKIADELWEILKSAS